MVQLPSRCHLESCVKRKSPKEGEEKRYYRQRLSPYNLSFRSQQGENHACTQEEAYHIDDTPSNCRTHVSRIARPARISPALTCPGAGRRQTGDRNGDD